MFLRAIVIIVALAVLAGAVGALVDPPSKRRPDPLPAREVRHFDFLP